MKKIIALSVILLVHSVCYSQTIFVKTVASGDGSGSSWENATNDLQKAIDLKGKHEVWIQAGTYVPGLAGVTSNNQSAHFIIKDGVDIFGGFNGTENSKSERTKSDLNNDGVIAPWEYNSQTILSGDISRNDNYADWPNNSNNKENCYQVVVQVSNFLTPTILDGICVQGGFNNSSLLARQPSGIILLNNVQLQNSIVRFNYTSVSESFGSGISSDSCKIYGCLITQNITDNDYSYGTGIYCKKSIVKNSKISHNKSLTYYSYGTGIYAESSEIENCTVESNYSLTKEGEGCGIYMLSGSVNSSNISNNLFEIREGHSFTNLFGGGVYSKKGVINNVEVQNNNAGIGGGIYTNSIVTNSKISFNNAYEGGGVYGLIARIEACEISYNKSSNGSGGGIFNYSDELKNGQIINCKVFANFSEYSGGGIYNYYGVVTGCLVYNNFSNKDYYSASGIESYDGLVSNCSVLNNESNIGDYTFGLLGSYYTNIANCVIWGNNTTSDQFKNLGTSGYNAVLDGDGIKNGENGNFILERKNTGSKGNYPGFKTPTTFFGLPVTKEDSMELVIADWSLMETSSLINSGNPDTAGLYLPDYCISSEYRVYKNIDIGAIEYMPLVITQSATIFSSDSVLLNGEIKNSFKPNVKSVGFKYSKEIDFSDFEILQKEYNGEKFFSLKIENPEIFKAYSFKAFVITMESDTVYGETLNMFISNPLNPTNGIIYVSTIPKGTGDGSSWQNATSDLIGALNIQVTDINVWVASGVYKPNGVFPFFTDRNLSFTPKEGVHVYGGFEGNEVFLSDRKKLDLDNNGFTEPWEYEHQTIFTGDIDTVPDNYNNWQEANKEEFMNGNCYHVVFQNNPFIISTVWDGLTIQGGFANNENGTNKGAGMYLQENLLLNNCIIKNNYAKGANASGAGAYLKNAFVTKCCFNQNYLNAEEGSGGGAFAVNSSIDSCWFNDNFTYGVSNKGGGLYLENGKVLNSSFFDNEMKGSVGKGGGLYNNYGNTVNCKVFNNNIIKALNDYYWPEGGGIYNSYGNVIGSLIFNNQVIDGNNPGIKNVNGRVINNTVCNNYSIVNGYESTLGIYSEGGEIVNSLIWNYKSLGETQLVYSHNCIVGFSALQQWKKNPDGFKGIVKLSDENCNKQVNDPCFLQPTGFSGIATNENQRAELFNSNWQLLKSSVCINKGIRDTLGLFLPVKTIMGEARMNDIVDIGANEYQGKPQTPPVAIAEAPDFVNEGELVFLSAKSSYDVNDEPLSFLWYADGIKFNNSDSVVTSFIVPYVSENKQLKISLIISDGYLSDSTSVIIKIQNSTKVIDKNAAKAIHVHPNPFTNKIFISFEVTDRYLLEIFSVTGVIVYSKYVNTKDFSIDTNYMKDNFYLLKITSKNSSEIIKLLRKEK